MEQLVPSANYHSYNSFIGSSVFVGIKLGKKFGRRRSGYAPIDMDDLESAIGTLNTARSQSSKYSPNSVKNYYSIARITSIHGVYTEYIEYILVVDM